MELASHSYSTLHSVTLCMAPCSKRQNSASTSHKMLRGIFLHECEKQCNRVGFAFPPVCKGYRLLVAVLFKLQGGAGSSSQAAPGRRLFFFSQSPSLFHSTAQLLPRNASVERHGQEHGWGKGPGSQGEKVRLPS